jgi:hypothetical protein
MLVVINRWTNDRKIIRCCTLVTEQDNTVTEADHPDR